MLNFLLFIDTLPVLAQQSNLVDAHITTTTFFFKFIDTTLNTQNTTLVTNYICKPKTNSNPKPVALKFDSKILECLSVPIKLLVSKSVPRFYGVGAVIHQ